MPRFDVLPDNNDLLERIPYFNQRPGFLLPFFFIRDRKRRPDIIAPAALISNKVRLILDSFAFALGRTCVDLYNADVNVKLPYTQLVEQNIFP